MNPSYFLALDLPEALQDEILELTPHIPGAYPEEPDTLHLTLCYFGPLHKDKLLPLRSAIRRWRLPSLALQLKEAGIFPPRGEPERIWLGVKANPELKVLRQKATHLAQQLGIPRDRKKYIPHVTLAKLTEAPESKVASYLAAHMLYDIPPFEIESMSLFSSWKRDFGHEYRREESFPLPLAPFKMGEEE